jgi:hypothetical protein
LEGKSLYGVRVVVPIFLTGALENDATETEGTSFWPAYKITKSLVDFFRCSQNWNLKRKGASLAPFSIASADEIIDRLRDVHYWHKADIAASLSDVRFRG